MRPSTFLHVWWNSLSRPSYYRELVRQPLSFSLRFAAVMLICLSLLATVVFRTRTLPQILTAVDQNATQLNQHYPVDLQVNWSGTELTSSQVPLQVPYPEQTPTESLPKFFAIIPGEDTAESDVPTKYADYFVVILPKTLWMQNQAHQWRSLALADLPGFDAPWQLTKSSLAGFEQRVRDGLKATLSAISWLYPLGWIPVVMIGQGILLSLNAGLLWLILKLTSAPIRYAKIWQIMLHCALIAEMANLLIQLLYGSHAQSLETIVFWVYFFVAFWQIQPQSKRSLSDEVDPN